MKKYTITRQVSEEELGGEVTVTQSSTNPEDRRVKIPVDVIRALKLASVKPLKGMCRVVDGEVVITIQAHNKNLHQTKTAGVKSGGEG
jgi:hypothetical protein